jgi:hypothetical protein
MEIITVILSLGLGCVFWYFVISKIVHYPSQRSDSHSRDDDDDDDDVLITFEEDKDLAFVDGVCVGSPSEERRRFNCQHLLEDKYDISKYDIDHRRDGVYRVRKRRK